VKWPDYINHPSRVPITGTHNHGHLRPTMISMAWKYGLLLICALFCNSSAQNNKQVENPAIWEPPPTIDFPGSVKASIPNEMITSLRVGGKSIVLDETDLKEVQRDVRGPIGHRGDAGDSLHWLCLRGRDARDEWVLWLMSGEINGGSVGGFRWQRVEQTAQVDTRCQTLPDGRSGVEFPLAVRLGTSEGEILRILGRPSNRHGDTLLYLHEHEMTIKNQPFTAMNTVAVLLRKQAVWAIEAWKSTTD
jgi:hypothetical protein